MSVLKIPGIKALLDNWHTKPCKSGEYKDIFDGNMCCIHLKAPNGMAALSFQISITKDKGLVGSSELGSIWKSIGMYCHLLMLF